MFVSCFFTIPVKTENARLRLALAVPTGDLITVANVAVQMYQLLLKLKNATKIIKNIKIVKRRNVFTKPFAH